ncbi:hypothetical protein GCM10011357_31370 [Lacimicrobium alkaliphilum]|uniref:Addiction module protein n=2 Tax=Lacimicrobium alkaliphilum TaxID=1526571 RepID=A0ABQ1RLJ8_9ALTE|nr:hypothetical protein GCM10011357_31370 [Lacimicrobium alkaliphilum]
MQIAKSEVLELLNQMPDECDLEELHYRLYVLEKIKRGQENYRDKGGVSQEEAENRMNKWVIS